MLFGSTTDSISATAGRRAIQINSSQHYLWRAVDQGGEVVDVLLQAKRDGAAAKRFFNWVGTKYVPSITVISGSVRLQNGIGQ